MTLTAAFASALAERAADDALALTIPVSLRHHAATHRMLGPFMNTLPLRIERPGDGFDDAVAAHARRDARRRSPIRTRLGAR